MQFPSVAAPPQDRNAVRVLSHEAVIQRNINFANRDAVHRQDVEHFPGRLLAQMAAQGAEQQELRRLVSWGRLLYHRRVISPTSVSDVHEPQYRRLIR